MEKTVVKPFRSLTQEQRHIIAYYTNKEKMQTLTGVLKMLDNSIGAYQKEKINEWIKDIVNIQVKKYIESNEQ